MDVDKKNFKIIWIDGLWKKNLELSESLEVKTDTWRTWESNTEGNTILNNISKTEGLFNNENLPPI